MARMTTDDITVGRYMTRSPHTIGRDQTLKTASEVMREHGVRHLPVLHGGQLLGILSNRDVFLVESLEGVDEEAVTVEEAMTAEPYIVAEGDDLKSVVTTMAESKFGAAVVMDGRTVVGIFTTIDALRALGDRL